MTFHLFQGGVKTPNLIPWEQHFTQAITKTIKEWLARLTVAGLVFTIVPVNVLTSEAKAQGALLAYSLQNSTIHSSDQPYIPVTLSDTSQLKPELGESRIEEAARLRRERFAIVKSAASSKRAPEPDLATKRALVQEAAAAYNVPWQVLEAVWQVESGKAWDTAVRSSAGAQGPAQFMPGTWRAYGVDADHDGVANVHSAIDAVYAAARYLAANGAAQGQIRQALLAYNHANWYVEKVLVVAREIGYEG